MVNSWPVPALGNLWRTVTSAWFPPLLKTSSPTYYHLQKAVNCVWKQLNLAPAVRFLRAASWPSSASSPPRSGWLSVLQKTNSTPRSYPLAGGRYLRLSSRHYDNLRDKTTAGCEEVWVSPVPDRLMYLDTWSPVPSWSSCVECAEKCEDKISHLPALPASLLRTLPLWNCNPKQTLSSCPDYGILSQLEKATDTGLKITSLHRYFSGLESRKIEYTWEQIRYVFNYVIPKYR